jgi:hypothetical protein
MKKWTFIGLGAVVVFLSAFSWSGWFGDKVDYNTEVKPILNKHCMGCEFSV